MLVSKRDSGGDASTGQEPPKGVLKNLRNKQKQIRLFLLLVISTGILSVSMSTTDRSLAAVAATPTITLTSPAINSTYIVNAATVTLTVADSNNTLFYNWDDNSNSSVTVSGGSASVTAPSAEGSHNLSVYAANATGTGEWASKYYEFTVQQETLSAVTFRIDSTSESSYTAEAAISFKWRSWRNFTTIKFYCYVILTGYSTILDSKTVTHSSYYAANGTVTKTATIFMDHDQAAWKYVSKGDTLILYVKAYNDSISAANILDSETATDTYPFSTEEASSSTTSTARTAATVALIAILLAAVAVIVAVYLFLGSQGFWTGTPLDSPFNYFNKSRDRFEIEGHTVYAERDKKGRFRDIVRHDRIVDRSKKAESERR